MRFFTPIFCVLALILAYSASADSYMTKAGIDACESGQPYSVYQRPGPGRHKLPAGFHCDYYDEVDNPVPSGEYSAPAAEPEPCEDNVACSALISDGDYCDAYGPQFLAVWGDLDDDGDYEAWCTEPIMTVVKILQEDPAAKATHEAAQAAKAAAAAAKAVSKGEKMGLCETALENWDISTLPAVKDCVRFLLYSHGK
jgi:hypothetical protein